MNVTVGATITLFTVNVAPPLAVPDVPVIVVVPAAKALASPFAFIVATAGFDDVQVAEVVRLALLPSE